MKKYNTVVIDPPWDITFTGKVNRTGKIKEKNRREKLPYKTMTLGEIAIFPMQNFANIGAHVYLWTTNKMLRTAFRVLDKWGIFFHLCMPWVKPSGICPCMGYQFASEFCLLGFYGNPMQKFIGMGKPNWVKAMYGSHSTKPDCFYELVEQMSPAPRIDIFARRKREGWDVWGDEV